MHGNRDGIETLADLLRRRTEQFPGRLAFVFEDETGAQVEWTYAQLDDKARTIAAWLTQRVSTEQRALLVYPAGLDFIAAFFGCLYAGVLPVPATYPKPRRPLPRLDTIASDCQPQVVLTHSSVLDGLCLDQQAPAVAELEWAATDKLESSLAADFSSVGRQGSDLAFLQYTSGSTSEPRGVMISHANLLHNLETIRQGFRIADEEVPTGVFWLPAYHDMGLIGGILTPIYVGGTSYLMGPTTFLRRPLRWLEVLSETQAEISGAPNFGYDLLVQKTTPAQRDGLDLSHWRLAFCGAEPIHPETLSEFATAFAVAGFRRAAFYPCYGMAEVTLLVSGGRGPGQSPVISVDQEQLRQHRAIAVATDQQGAQLLVGCGATFAGQQVLIVNPQSHVVCADGEVGEIWVRGASVARGYWNREEINRETFGATLASDSRSGDSRTGYLRTGDLGFWLAGELYVTGRLKDVIIIRGRNHYPQDIERTAVEAHEAVGLGAAFAVAGKRQEKLVVVHQVNREHRKANFEEVIRAIRTAIVAEHELDPGAIVLIKPVSLPITSSGKVQRQRCCQQYLAGELAVMAQWSAAQAAGEEADAVQTPPEPKFLPAVLQADAPQLQADLESWLIDWLTVRAELNPGVMQPSTPFAELGIDSLTAVEISQDLEKALELELPPMVIWSCPTCQAMAAYLVEELVADRRGERKSVLPSSSNLRE